MAEKRWTHRPEGSNWGDFGPDDQLGRLNLVTPERRRRAVEEVREGMAFCLSLPLDCPNVVINPRRFPPVFAYSMRGEDPVMNYPMERTNPDQTDVVCDDKVTLSLQFSTQWDSLCHIGSLYDAHGTGEVEATYYNGYSAHRHVHGPFDYVRGRTLKEGPYGAGALGIETIAETGLQTRGVMIDFLAHFGLEKTPVGYDALMRVLEADKVEVEPGDVLCFRTGFDQALLARYRDPSAPFDPHRCSGLDGTDPALLRWITNSGAVALLSDNELWSRRCSPIRRPCTAAVRASVTGRALPVLLGAPLGELFLLAASSLTGCGARGRFRFLLTAPPLRLPGAVGSPTTAVGTV